MVPNNTTDGTPTQPSTAIQWQHKSINIHSPVWATQLQCSPLCNNRYGKHGPQQTQQTQHFCPTLYKRMGIWDIAWTLSLLESMEQGHKSNTNIRHSICQTQIHHQSNSHTSGCHTKHDHAKVSLTEFCAHPEPHSGGRKRLKWTPMAWEDPCCPCSASSSCPNCNCPCIKASQPCHNYDPGHKKCSSTVAKHNRIIGRTNRLCISLEDQSCLYTAPWYI